MMNVLALRFPRLWLVLGWIFVLLAVLVCLAPPGTPGMSGLFVWNDKVEHASGYVALTLWFTGLYPRSKYGWIAAGLFAMGVGIELLQGWMAMGREADPLDVAANTTGIAVGIVLALLAFGGWAQRIERIFDKRGR
jgi:VanZ family protein